MRRKILPTAIARATLFFVVVLCCGQGISMKPEQHDGQPSTLSEPSKLRKVHYYQDSSNHNFDPMMATGATAENGCNPPKCCIENFRQVAGICNIYRCASTDGLANIDFNFDGDNDRLNNTNRSNCPDRFVLYEAGLIIDLRSPSERDEKLAQQWMSRASIATVTKLTGPIVVLNDKHRFSPIIQNNKKYGQLRQRRFVVRIDILSTPKFMSYIHENWLSPIQQAQAVICNLIDDGRKSHEIRIESLNERGLAGLNEAILETAKYDLRLALEVVTLHFETNANSTIVFHCVQGKDR